MLGYKRLITNKKNDEKMYQWGKDLAFFIDSLLLQGRYYTPYRFAGNLTPEQEQPLSYYITIPEIFNILKIRYPLLSNDKVMKMLEEKNLVSNYFDKTSYTQSIEYVTKEMNNSIDEATSSYTYSIHNNDGHNVSKNTRKLLEKL